MNKKVEYTKQKLLDALIELMTRKKLSEITVTELCQAAGINRTTFYRHFSVPQDVFADNLRVNTSRIEDVIAATYDERDNRNDIYLKMLKLCQITEKHYGAFYEVLRSGNNIDALTQPIFNYLLRQGYTSFEDEARETFVIGGITALYNLWCRNAFKPSPEQMARLMADLAIGAID